MTRAIRIGCLVLLLGLAGLWGAAWVGRAPGEGVADAFARGVIGLLRPATPAAVPDTAVVNLAPGTALGGNFHLTDQAGRAVTAADFAGRWLLVYFGYTYCPDVCPTELAKVASALDVLGAAGEAVTPVFVTVDPERDTPAQLATYVAAFHPRLVGLTGTAAEIAAVTREYRVYYARARSAGMSDYLMDHSSFIYLVGPDGMVRALFRPEATPEMIAAATAARLHAS